MANSGKNVKASHGGGGAAPAVATETSTGCTPTAAGHRTLFQGVERDGFGMRMLTSMGWQEGKGVGKDGGGITKHIQAKKRSINSGIGADVKTDVTGKMDWTLNAVTFDNMLKGLNESYTVADVESGGGGR